MRLSGLKEETVYEVQVRAVNEEGMSEWSESGEGRTDREEADPEDPSDFSGEDLEGRRLTLRLTGEEGPPEASSFGSEKAIVSNRSSRSESKPPPGPRAPHPDPAPTAMRRQAPAWER